MGTSTCSLAKEIRVARIPNASGSLPISHLRYKGDIFDLDYRLVRIVGIVDKKHIGRLMVRKVIDQTDLVTQLYELGSIQFGDFTMASGLQSPVYIDLRRLIARPVLLNLVAQSYIDILDDLVFDHLAAVPYGALAIGTAVSLAMDRPLIFPRKEAKSHGTGRIIEGLYSADDKVVIIEDLVTKGGSALKAIEVLKAAELVVSDVVVLIDREQGGREAINSHGYLLHAVLTLSEMLNLLQEQEHISADEAKAVQEYLATTS